MDDENKLLMKKREKENESCFPSLKVYDRKCNKKRLSLHASTLYSHIMLKMGSGNNNKNFLLTQQRNVKSNTNLPFLFLGIT